ncbi:MAG TPA: hypothetical protein EYH05_17085 [Anaerolineae bacterium]|nr:hypothetical protein [Anaerolineae bacterium]
MVEQLPSPKEWLDTELEKMGISRNEFGHRYRIATSAIHKFTIGECGAQTAVNIANALNVSPAYTLALIGKAPPPPSMEFADIDKLAHIFGSLDNEARQMLLSYAEFLRARHRHS